MGDDKDNRTGSQKSVNVEQFGIKETDSCPVCKRQLKALIEENNGGFLVGQSGEWICLSCGVLFMPKSKIRIIIENMEKATRKIIVPSFVPPADIRNS